MDRVTCAINKKASGYEILIGNSLLDNASKYLSPFIKGKRIVVVTDSTVAPLYADRLVSALSSYEVSVFTFPAGEKSKCFATISGIYDFLCEHSLTREDTMIALGGGVTGDMCGFAAATYLRGIPFIQIPTTLLADVDSSVGGKTGYDLPCGKNLIGAFYQPKMVLIDTDLLSTLDSKIYADGMAEVIKTALLSDMDMFDLVSHRELSNSEMIFRCVHYKSVIVEADELDNDIRGLLNLGHTFGHAIEKLGGYKKHSHGQGVAIGTVIACKIGEYMGKTQRGIAKAAADAFSAYGLPTQSPYSAEEIFSALRNDKKANSNGIKIILLSNIGDGFIYQASFEELENLLKQVID